MNISEMHYQLFETDIGGLGIMWSSQGICHIQLPERNNQATRDRLLAFRWAEEASPPPNVKAVIKSLCRHLSGNPQSFDGVELDLSFVPRFHARVYDALRKLPSGVTVSYGELAELAGSRNAARAVGRAMAKNPVPIIIPCHRVLASRGNIGGFSAYGGAKIKVELLKLEGLSPSPSSQSLPE